MPAVVVSSSDSVVVAATVVVAASVVVAAAVVVATSFTKYQDMLIAFCSCLYHNNSKLYRPKPIISDKTYIHLDTMG